MHVLLTMAGIWGVVYVYIVCSTRAIVHGKHLSQQICTRHLVIIFGDVVFVLVCVRVRGGTFGE